MRRHYITKQKVAVISEHASPLTVVGGVEAGGQNIAVAELTQHLARSGYQVDVFTRWDDPDQPEIVHWQSGVRVIHVKAGPVSYVIKEEMLPMMDEFTKHLTWFMQNEEEPYQLIHAHFFMSGLVAANIKRILGIPFVVTFHALGEVRRQYQGSCDRFPKERLLVEQRVMAEADRIIALCPQDRDDLLTLYGADPQKLTIIGNGFNPDEFFPLPPDTARTQLDIPTTGPVILQLGRMVPRKGVDTVISALGVLKRDYKLSARLLVVGGESADPDSSKTPEIARLQQLAMTEGVADQVTFTGRRGRDSLRYYYSAADVFVITPWYEPFGITPLEAMACGTPVIGSNVGGIKHTVRDQKTGFLVPPRQPKALAERLSVLLTNPDLMHRMGQRALRHVQQHYTWHQVACQTADLYQDVLSNSHLATRLREERQQHGLPALVSSNKLALR
ncbi:glycosyltransferase involved in cell wall biosynthesis [Spirosoma lacussanchae]|uniref:glycosyltransferase family 4 protein n=1 Tax=Spirosoma lacussanchae TaxID=1884249 RepID=UPI001108FFAF|nr:glycosyltransferase family 1 protein [Spirosoma lacussanchae]